MRTLLLVIIFAVGGYYLGYQAGSSGKSITGGVMPSATVDTSRARELGAEARDQATTAGARAKAELTETSITARIKAKMALDDLVKAGNVDVTTEGSIVTLTGTVATDAERTRAERIAKETDGVTSVVNRLTVGPPPR